MHLEREYYSEDLENLAPHSWMMSAQSSANISALHRQRVKGRRIIITEDPRLHLVWVNARIFIKPLPAYLLSFVFWSIFLCPHGPDGSASVPLFLEVEDRKRQARITRTALGYLRTFIRCGLFRNALHILLERERSLLRSWLTYECAPLDEP